ncbi:hypothetical protein EV664_11851 [Stakelama pacifica]|uniref:Uncharacterized protein n=1 Tax=Stakelama pacifica TaxID=517720 RepID=A0A4R6FB42_9SPHN|nr:hypothetical protein EV664_11851 [Stakelama pacifica]
MSRRHRSHRRRRPRLLVSGRGLALVSLGIAAAMLCGLVLGQYTTSHMRRDFAYGYDVPDAGSAKRRAVADYETPSPTRVGQDAAFHASVTGDEAADFDSVYFPDPSDGG